MWELIREELLKEQYIKPLGEDHEDTKCWCNPRYEELNGWKLFIHNSLDGREKREHDYTAKPGRNVVSS